MQPTRRYVILFIMLSWLGGNGVIRTEVEAVVADGMVGRIPDKLVRIIAYLKRVNSKDAQGVEQTRALFKNRFILYGPPGNGKSMLAYKMAELSGSEFLRLDGPSIVGSYVGQGANSVKETFEQARNIVKNMKRCVIIFIDEIDAIAVSNNTEFRGEHQAALQQLWLELDHCKNNPLIFVVFATNYFNKLNKTFLDRFGSNILEVKNPDFSMRRQIMEYYSERYQLPMSKGLINLIAKKSENLSIRSLEDLVCDLALSQPELGDSVDEVEVLKVLAQVRSKFENNISDKKEGIDSELQKWSLRVGIVTGVLGGMMTACQLFVTLHSMGKQKPVYVR